MKSVIMTEENNIYIPIPHFPPFKLRSSLIDKDPVIWVHLLEAYIRLFQFLVASGNSNSLTVKSQQQLQIFMKVYLSETAEESTKIFSLGNINPEIKQNTSILRSYVFHYVKTHSLVKAKLSGESIWNFIKVYINGNSNTVRGLVDGTYQSPFNDNKKSGKISSIGMIQTYMESLISNKKFTSQDLSSLSFLLGQYTKAISKSSTYNLDQSISKMKVNKKVLSSSNFAEKFVDVSWIEMLEKLYGNGSSVHAKVIENIMLVSVLSLSVAKLSKLATELKIFNAKALSLFPLFSTIIISDTYKELIPGLEERLPFLGSITIGDYENENIIADDGNIQVLLDFFPQLTVGKAKTILEDNNNDVEHVTNILWESPEQIERIKEKAESNPSQDKSLTSSSNKLTYSKEELPDMLPNQTVLLGKKVKDYDLTRSEEFRKKSLSTILSLIYQDDEDEPDDTYIENEATTGEDIDNSDIDRYKEIKQGEMVLFSYFRSMGPERFDKSSHNPEIFNDMRKDSGMSNQQIHSFFRRLLSTPKMFDAFEDAFFFNGNPNKGPRNRNMTPKPTPNIQLAEKDKFSKMKDEKNKSKKANHKRKAAHGKKVANNLKGMQNE